MQMKKVPENKYKRQYFYNIQAGGAVRRSGAVHTAETMMVVNFRQYHVCKL